MKELIDSLKNIPKIMNSINKIKDMRKVQQQLDNSIIMLKKFKYKENNLEELITKRTDLKMEIAMEHEAVKKVISLILVDIIIEFLINDEK